MSSSVAGFGTSMRPARIAVGFIVGPTGAGKSALAMAVAERSNCEIVNADSRQFYRGMDLGTAKPSADDRRRVPHHLIDVRDPDQSLDVAEFAQLARAAIENIAARGRNPLVVGGSGLYLRVIRGGIFRGPAASPEIRDRLAKVAEEQGVAHLHQRLRDLDPESANRIGVNDLYRIVRALEVFELTGENNFGASASPSIRRHRLRHLDHRHRSRTQKTLRRYRRALRRDGRSRSGRGSARADPGWILAREATAQYDWIQTNRGAICAAR